MIPRPYQVKAVNAWLDHLRVSDEGTLIVAPTGSGKSLIIAECCKEFFKVRSGKILVLSHRKEILRQNADKLYRVLPEYSVGVFSASLKSKRIGKITVAGVQSIVKHLKTLECPSLIIIDEAHLVPPEGEGNYQKVIKAFKGTPILGLTATPYRLKGGALTEGGIFKSICYDIQIKELIEQGFLAPLVSKSSVIQGDLVGVRKTAGEFNLSQLAERMNKSEVTEKAISEVFWYAKETKRESAIFFCTSIEHVEEVTRALKTRGVRAEGITSKTLPIQADQHIQAFKTKKLNALVSCEILTTGFDAPIVDMIVMLRPTLSASLFVQMCGRGMRIAPGKKDCLVLDYAGNFLRHGHIDKIFMPSKKNNGEKGEAVFKACPECREVVHGAVRTCPACAFEFPIVGLPLSDSASVINPLSFQSPLQSSKVVSTRVLKHKKQEDSLCVVFQCELSHYADYLCFDHSSPNVRRFALKKWMTYTRSSLEPKSTDEAFRMWDQGMVSFDRVERVYTKQDGKWTRIVSVDLMSEEEFKKKEEDEILI